MDSGRRRDLQRRRPGGGGRRSTARPGAAMESVPGIPRQGRGRMRTLRNGRRQEGRSPTMSTWRRGLAVDGKAWRAAMESKVWEGMNGEEEREG